MPIAEASEQIPASIGEELSQLFGLTPDVRLDRLAALEPVYKEELAKWSTVWLDQRPAYVRRSELDEAFLVHLGNEEAMARAVLDFSGEDRFGWGLYFVNARNPHIIELLAPFLFREEPIDMRGRDIPLSFRAADVIQMILQRAPQFTDEVHRWARSDKPFENSILGRATMRQWWVQNERFFRMQNYAAVGPGSGAEPTPSVRYQGIPSRSEHSEPQTNESLDQRVSDAASQPALVQDRVSTGMYIAGTIVALAGAVFLLWSRAKTR